MRQLKWAGIVLAIVFLAACATTGQTTQKQRLAYMYQIYNAQHEDYVSMAKNPNITEGQKEVLRFKKPILVSLQTLIPAYDSKVQAGTPSFEQEQQIYNLLNKLEGLVPIN